MVLFAFLSRGRNLPGRGIGLHGMDGLKRSDKRYDCKPQVLRAKPLASELVSGFIILINMLFRPLRFIADKVNVIQRGIVAADRVFRLLDRDESIPDTGTYKPQQIEGKIDFENVWFAYNDEDYVLKDISFEVNAGETLAIVGATGSGKTSTISILGQVLRRQQRLHKS